MTAHELHETARQLAKHYLTLEAELISLLQRIEKERVYLQVHSNSVGIQSGHYARA